MDQTSTNPPVAPFLGWAGWKHFGLFIGLYLIQSLWFAVVYGGADYWAGQHAFRVPVHWEIERRMPFVPEMMGFYMSIYLLFWMAPFILRTTRELQALTWTHAGATLIAGICFFLLPAELAYPAPTDTGRWPQLFHFADRLNLQYNLLPSLHVAFSVACVTVYHRKASRIRKTLLWSWAGAIALSTLLTHQHHVADVITGWGLGVLATRTIYDPLTGAA